MGYTRDYADRMGLAATAPSTSLASTQYCLANPGKEYLVYLPDGGDVTVDLSAAAGRLNVEWFNPRRQADRCRTSRRRREAGIPATLRGRGRPVPLEGPIAAILRDSQVGIPACL